MGCDDAWERGFIAEDAVRMVLINLERGCEIGGFYQNKPNGEIDMLGIDFLVYLKNGFILPIQVKASLQNTKASIAMHLKRHPHVPFMIFVNLELYKVHPEKVQDRIAEEIRGFLKD